MSYADKFKQALFLEHKDQTFVLRAIDGYTFEYIIIEGGTQVFHRNVTVEGREPFDRKLMARQGFVEFIINHGVPANKASQASKPPASFHTWWRDR